MNAKAKKKEKRLATRQAQREQDASKQVATSAAASSAAVPDEDDYDVQACLDSIWLDLKDEEPTTTADWATPRFKQHEWACLERASDTLGTAVRGRMAMLFREGTYEPTYLELNYCIIAICNKIMPMLAQSMFDLRAQRMATRIAAIEAGLHWRIIPEGAQQQKCVEAHYACKEGPNVRVEQGPSGGPAATQQADPLQEEMWQRALQKAKQIVADGAGDSTVRDHAVKIYRMRKKRLKFKASKVHAQCMAGSE